MITMTCDICGCILKETKTRRRISFGGERDDIKTLRIDDDYLDVCDDCFPKVRELINKLGEEYGRQNII